jgi:glycosyltransferase involved in cell wall biosynthesis
MKISVVVPTYNRARFVVRTITSLIEQTLAPVDIVVVDNGSTDDTAAVVHDMKSSVKRLRHILEPQLGVSRVRNRGAAEASGNLVAFLDDDAVASPHWLEALADAALSLPSAAAFAGPIGLRWTRSAPAWVQGLEGWYGRFDLGEERKTIDYPLYPFASNVAFRREAFLSAGGFPVELGPRGGHRIANEEDGLFRRVAERGWTVVYEPTALVYHWVHAERLSRRYLLRRSFTQGKSDVLVDAIFAPSRSRSVRARRSLAAAEDAIDAGRIALKRRRDAIPLGALIASSASVGRAVQDGRLSLAIRPRARPSPVETPPASGLTAAQLGAFDRDGFVRIPGAFQGVDAMQDRMWGFLARRGINRDDPATWPTGDVRHLQKLLRDAAFMPIGGPGTTAAIDDLLGPGRWARPEHWGEFLVTFPDSRRRWTVPTLWHTDAAYHDPLWPLLGVMVFSFLNDVEHRGGGTLVAAGSHRLVARFVAERLNVCEEKSSLTRKAFYQSHPWLADLLTTDDDAQRYDRLFTETDIDGLPARVVELTGNGGDIVIAHPLLAHCVSPNCARQPRFMRILRPRLRAE